MTYFCNLTHAVKNIRIYIYTLIQQHYFLKIASDVAYLLSTYSSFDKIELQKINTTN